jgi:hypothetical protein
MQAPAVIPTLIQLTSYDRVDRTLLGRAHGPSFGTLADAMITYHS